MWLPHFRFLREAKMVSFVSLLLVGIMFPALQAKQFTKCELSQVLRDMDGYGSITLPECEFLLCFASSHSPSASDFTLLSLPFSSPLSLNYRILLIFFAYLFTFLSHLFIYLSFLPRSDPFRNSSFHLIKMLCDIPYLEVGWRAFSCLGIQVPIYAVPRHLCDTSFSSFPQGSAQYFTSVVMTHKP